MLGYVAAALIPVAAVVAIAAWRGPWGRSHNDTDTLEKILTATHRLNGMRDLPELAEGITAAVGDILGVGLTALYLWSDETKSFEAQSLKGDGRTMAAVPLTWDEFQAIGGSCRRLGAGFLCPKATRTGASGGELIWPLETASGEVTGFLALGFRQGERPADEAGLRPLEFLARQATTALESARVFDALAHRNEELSAASRQLQGLADMKKNLVANVGHELRTPLTSISAYTEMVQRNLGTLDQGSLDDFLKVIASESEKLSAVINDILDLDRMDQERAVTEPEDTNLSVLMDQMAEPWKVAAEDGGLDLHVTTSSRHILLPVDPVLVRQLLTHLVGNAIKFTPSGGRVSVDLRETGTAVQLAVEDTGIGIPPDQLGTIFEGFYQVDGSPTRSHNGQGLGLAICRDIVHHHDGLIWAENGSDGGARFMVQLPRRARVQQPADPPWAGDLPFAPGEFMARLLHWVAEAMGVQVATLMVPDEQDDHLEVAGAIGLPPAVVQSTRVRRGTGFAGRVWANGKPLLIEDVTRMAGNPREVNEPRYSTSSLLCVPLKAGGQVVGVLSVNNRTDGRVLDHDDLAFLENLTPTLGMLLARHRRWQQELHFFRDVRKALRTTTPVGHHRRETLLAVCREICLAAARELGLPSEDLGRLAQALQFYDVGLESVPRGILRQAEPLTDGQRRMVKGHVRESLRILAPLSPDPGVSRLILHHHENFDGSGYPAGLAGEAIPVGARLIRLADSLESMLSDRPGRDALTLEEAQAEIAQEAGRLFCPRMTAVFLTETERRRDRILALQDRSGIVAGLIRQSHAEPVVSV